MWGTDWAASRRMRQPCLWASRTYSRTGLMVPRTFDTCVMVTSLIPPDSRCWRKSSWTRWPSSVSPTYFKCAPFCLARSCQGTMLLWCSISVRRIPSPRPTFVRPHDCATRLIASVVPRTKMISFGLFAFISRAILARASS